MLEPEKTKKKIPNLMLVPILVFDKHKHRLGYGKGFYDRYLNKYLKKFNNILTVGIAFSFQNFLQFVDVIPHVVQVFRQFCV